MFKGYIYCYTCKDTNLKYIGQTIWTPEKRAGHNGMHYKTCTKFYNAIKKYGWSSMQLEVLDELEFETKVELINTLNKLEESYIILFDTINNGYNICSGGDNKLVGPNTGKHASEETREKLRAAHKGYKHTEEAKQKMKDACAKRTGPGNAKGLQRSEETKKKISDAIKKHWETRSRQASQETKDKLSDSLKKYWAENEEAHIKNSERVTKWWEDKKNANLDRGDM